MTTLELSYVNDHLVEERLVLREILQQLVFGHPHMVLALADVQPRGADHLRLEKETLPEALKGLKDYSIAVYQTSKLVFLTKKCKQLKV